MILFEFFGIFVLIYLEQKLYLKYAKLIQVAKLIRSSLMASEIYLNSDAIFKLLLRPPMIFQTFNNIVFSIGFFNTIVNVCLILDNYDIPVTYKNIASVCCDYAILL